MISLENIKSNLIKNVELEVLDSVLSTNDYILDKNVFAVIAKSQTKGKGTKERSFFSPQGGIYMSIKFTPKISLDRLNLLTPFTATVASNAIDKITGLKTKIKWVNDIYLNDKKLCGILTENKIVGDSVTSVIGIGINVLKQEFPSFELNKPISIEEVLGNPPNSNKIIAEILNSFINFDSLFNCNKFISEYKERSLILGKKVLYVNGNAKTICVVLDINSDCSLKLKTDSGEIINVSSGEIRL